MAFLLPDQSPDPVPVPIVTKEGGFCLTLRRPTFAEAMRHDSLADQSSDDPEGRHFAAMVAMRLSLVVDWRGVQVLPVPKDGQIHAPVDLPFSTDRFQQLLLKSPEAFNQFSKAAAALMQGRSPGESDAASGNG